VIARDSLGGVLAVAARLGPAGTELAEAARVAFVEAMGTAAFVGAGVTLLGAAVTFLPARPRHQAHVEVKEPAARATGAGFARVNEAGKGQLRCADTAVGSLRQSEPAQVTDPT